MSASIASRFLARLSTSPRLGASLPRAGSASSSSPLILASWSCKNRLSLIESRREMHASAPRSHGGKGKPKPGEGVTLIFKKSNGEHVQTVEANIGDDIVDVSWEYDLDIEAACEKSIACSTCHVILESDVYDQLEEPSDDEVRCRGEPSPLEAGADVNRLSHPQNDMLDLAFGLTDTSRLGCQIKVTKAMNNSVITLPSATRNLRVDGSKPSH